MASLMVLIGACCLDPLRNLGDYPGLKNWVTPLQLRLLMAINFYLFGANPEYFLILMWVCCQGGNDFSVLRTWGPWSWWAGNLLKCTKFWVVSERQEFASQWEPWCWSLEWECLSVCVQSVAFELPMTQHMHVTEVGHPWANTSVLCLVWWDGPW